MTFGERDGAPFFHCHGLWTEADGRFRGGPYAARGDRACRIVPRRCLWSFGSGLRRRAGPRNEFQAVRSCSRRRPPADTAMNRAGLCTSPSSQSGFCFRRSKTFAARAGIGPGALRGGVGSIIGAHFEDGRSVEPFATEMAVSQAGYAASAGWPDGRTRHLSRRSSWRYSRGTAEARRQSRS